MVKATPTTLLPGPSLAVRFNWFEGKELKFFDSLCYSLPRKDELVSLPNESHPRQVITVQHFATGLEPVDLKAPCVFLSEPKKK